MELMIYLILWAKQFTNMAYWYVGIVIINLSHIATIFELGEYVNDAEK